MSVKTSKSKKTQARWQKRSKAEAFMEGLNTQALMGPPESRHILLWVCVLFIAVLFIWSAFAKIDQVTQGFGKVVPAGRVQVIQHLEGGVIEKILVQEGQFVEEGQVLMEIDDTSSLSLYRDGLLRAAALEARITRLTAEAKGTPFTPPEHLKNEYQTYVTNEKESYEANQKNLSDRKKILGQQVKQQGRELDALQARIKKLETNYGITKQELGMTQGLLKAGAASKIEVLRLEQQANELQGQKDEANYTYLRTQETLTEVQQRLEELESTFRSEAAKELVVTKAQLASQNETNRSLKDRLTRTVLKAPVSGTIKVMHVNTIGSTVKPGEDLIEIVPFDAELFVEAKVVPKDIGFIHPGQAAIIKLTAYDFVIYGWIEGEVKSISADTVTDSEGNTFYLVKVTPNKTNLGTKEKPLPILPGMTAEVDIITGKRSVLTYLLKPILRGSHQALGER